MAGPCATVRPGVLTVALALLGQKAEPPERASSKTAPLAQEQKRKISQEMARRFGKLLDTSPSVGVEKAACREEALFTSLTAAETDVKARVMVTVWELQRRWTLFHTTWQAPFLPHDGEKSWRWVDMDYREHPWAVPPLAASAAAAVPIIEPPEKEWGQGEQQTTWNVAEPGGPCDQQGWQYAVDFYQDRSYWVSTSQWHHCRRRLWKGVFLKPADASILNQPGPIAKSVNYD